MDRIPRQARNAHPGHGGEPEGFSLVEVLLATSLFALLVVGVVGALVYGRESVATSGERTRATALAEEGLEAARNIRDESYAGLAAGTHGLAIGGGQWTLSGGSDTTDGFTRTLVVTAVDAVRKLVTATVTWQATPTRQGSVSAQTYLTNWRASAPGGGNRAGMLVYADTTVNGGDGVVYRTLDTLGNWSAPTTIPDIGVLLDRPAVRLELYTSKTRNEKILVTKHAANGAGNDQYLFAQVWNGTNWGDKIQLGTGWTGLLTADGRNFDGAYLNNGDFVLVFDDNTNTPKYVVWNGTSWSPAPVLGVDLGSATVDVGGNPEWIVVKNRPGTNQVMLGVLDAAQDTNTSLFDGSTWSVATEHGTASPTADVQGIDFTWSRNSPTNGALVFNEAADNFPNIRIWNGTTWSSSIENIDIGGVTRSMQIVDRPGANEFIACVSDNNVTADINCLESNMTPLWSTLTNGELSIETDSGTQRSFGLGYEAVSGAIGLAMFADNPNPHLPRSRTFDPATNTWSASTMHGNLGSAFSGLETVRVVPDLLGDNILVLMGASDQDLWTYGWDGTLNAFFGSAGLVQTEHGTNGTGDTDFWFDFEWNQF